MEAKKGEDAIRRDCWVKTINALCGLLYTVGGEDLIEHVDAAADGGLNKWLSTAMGAHL